MVINQLPPPVWVDSSKTLQKLAGELMHQSRIAVDTESNSLYAYRERVCLIQFSTPKTDYLVDPLALKDLTPLAPLFADPGVEKVFHAAEYDLICLRRDFGFEVANLFDTMLAARILGYRKVGLGDLLTKKLGIVVNKRYQKANWGQRPLAADLLDYARLDTHHLLTLRYLLASELEKTGRGPLASEDFSRISQVEEHNNHIQPSWQRIKGGHKLRGNSLAILQELSEWREDLAQRMDLPLFKVLQDSSLVSIAEWVPQTLQQLQSAGLSPRQVRRFGYELLQAVQRGLKASPVERPTTIRPDSGFLARLDALGRWRKRIARTMGVESDVVLPRPYLQSIALKNPENMSDLSKAMPHSRWRLEHYGTEILAVIGRLENVCASTSMEQPKR